MLKVYAEKNLFFLISYFHSRELDLIAFGEKMLPYIKIIHLNCIADILIGFHMIEKLIGNVVPKKLYIF